MASIPETAHSDWASLYDSWMLVLESDSYSPSSRRAYTLALVSFVQTLPGHQGPLDVTRDDIRRWLVHVRDTRSQSTARGWLSGLRHFFAWLVTEEERTDDPAAGVKTPAPAQATTQTLKADDLKALLGTCDSGSFRGRRDAAIIRLFLDSGLRLAELTDLALNDVDIRDRCVYVKGKGTKRSGPRHRVSPIGVRTAKALDRYLRERRKHPYAETSKLWLGDRNRPNLTTDGVKRMLKRRAETAGVEEIHPHMFRHTFAHNWLADGGTEGDLMRIAGWSSRQMLDRYGASVATERAREAHKRHSFGDRI